MKFYKRYKPLLELNNSVFDVIALTGGRGSMKTGHALRGILICSTQAKKKTCFFRETKDTLEDSLKAELDGIIDIEFFDRGFTRTTKYIKHKNGSYIFFKGLKEVNKQAIQNLKGIATTTDFFVVDEAQAVSKAVWDVLIPTLRKAGCVLIVIYNRISNNLPVEECLFLDYKRMQAPKNTYFIEVNYTEILHLGLLGEQFTCRADLVKANDYEKYKRDYLNDADTNADVKVVPYWSTDNIKDINYVPGIDLHITCDFNIAPNCWLLAHVHQDKIYFFDEFCLDLVTPNLIKVILDKYNHANRIIINGDASGDNGKSNSQNTDFIEIRNELIRRGYRQECLDVQSGKRFKFDLRHANGSRKARFMAWNNKILNIETGQREIYVSSKCKKLIYNCEELKVIPGTSEFDIPSVSKIKADPELRFLGHPFDAASYLVNTYWPVNFVRIKKDLKPDYGIPSQNNFNHLLKGKK